MKQTLEKPWQNFKSFKKTLLMASEVSHIEVDNVKLSVEEIERIEGNLNTYINHTEKAITEIKTGGGE